jgi:hypothetical protein
VKVRVPPLVTDRPLLPEARVVATVTLLAGAADSDTPTVAELPCATLSVAGLTVIEPLVPVVWPVQVTPLRVKAVGLVLVPE